MRAWHSTGTALAGMCAVGTLAGCGGGNGDDGPKYVDLSGNWTGRYVSPEVNQNVVATITQDRDALVIETSLRSIGHVLTGNIDTNGQIRLTDAFDGETWTSHGPVSTNAFLIRDYLWDPILGRESPDQGIYFNR